MTTATAAPDPVPARAGEAGTAASGYLNLHQCVYGSEADTSHLTTVVPTSDSRFATGTKVSDSAGTRPACGPGDGDHVLVPLLSSVRSFPLA
ncbi:hypothetical protein ACH5A3_37630 [Streptomyces echinatus]|uniref:hypothetical protein n=1 Tax=Streptomyces echinatus TaxID=67293 RepID=UPI00378DA3D1